MNKKGLTIYSSHLSLWIGGVETVRQVVGREKSHMAATSSDLPAMPSKKPATSSGAAVPPVASSVPEFLKGSFSA